MPPVPLRAIRHRPHGQVTRSGLAVVADHPGPLAIRAPAGLEKTSLRWWCSSRRRARTARLPSQRLEILKEAVPQSTRIAVLANPASPAHEARMHNLTMAARALGLPLHVVEVRSADELAPAFVAMTRAGADAVIALEDAVLLNGQRGRGVADLAVKSRLPVMYAWGEWVVAGGLMSYGPSELDTNRRAAVYVDKILKGAKAADLPVEQSTKFNLVLTLKTAQALDITIPPHLLMLADEVIR